MPQHITIDGSLGEGGGQMLRLGTRVVDPDPSALQNDQHPCGAGEAGVTASASCICESGGEDLQCRL